MQNVFSKLYIIDKEKLPQDKESSWLYTVTKNETLLFLRKKNNNIDIESIYDIENSYNDIENLIDIETYNNLITKLNNKEREIVSLKIISNLSFNQIAELLGEPTGTIKWRYYKSIYTLRILLSNLGMFIITFITGIFMLKNTKKSAKEEKNQEISYNEVENLRDDAEKKNTENATAQNQELENTIITEQIIQHNTNYLGYGVIGVSCVFLILTIIFAIILKKYQPNSRRKSSK